MSTQSIIELEDVINKNSQLCSDLNFLIDEEMSKDNEAEYDTFLKQNVAAARAHLFTQKDQLKLKLNFDNMGQGFQIPS